MKVAIVYDRVNKWGGAERVLLVLHEIFPKAPLFTSVYDRRQASWAKVFPKVHTTSLQKLPLARRNHEYLALFMPWAFRQFSFVGYDLVISVTSEAAKGIVVGPGTKHICLCLTPTRYLWSGYSTYFPSRLLRFLSWPIIFYLRKWDRKAALGPHVLIAISKEVQKRIKKYYRRDSILIFPPLTKTLRSQRIVKNLPKKYFLVVSRLVPYKKVDLAIKAFNLLQLPLVVVGEGLEAEKLKRIADRNIVFLGKVKDPELAYLYKNCRALIFPQNEDFGLVAVEAMSFGKPVVACKAGGALDIVKEGVNGVFFRNQSVKSLVQVIHRFDKMTFHSGKIVGTINKFSKTNFKKNLLEVIKKI